MEEMAEFEKKEGLETVPQAEIVNRLVQKLEIGDGADGTSITRSVETSKKIQNVI